MMGRAGSATSSVNQSTSASLVRRSSNAIRVAAFEPAGRFRWPSPQEGGGIAIPVLDTGLQRGGDLLGAAAGAAVQRPLGQHLPIALDEVQPGGGLGQRDEMEAGMAPVPEQ